MPQIHLQSALFFISLFIMQRSMPTYNRNPQQHASHKNSRKCFIFSIHPSSFEINTKRNKNNSRWEGLILQKRSIHSITNISICSFQFCMPCQSNKLKTKKAYLKRENVGNLVLVNTLLFKSKNYKLLKRLFPLRTLVLFPSHSSHYFPSTKGSIQKVGEEVVNPTGKLPKSHQQKKKKERLLHLQS